MKRLLISALFLLFFCTAASATVMTLAWNDTNNDLCFITGYRVFQGTAPGVYDVVNDVGKGVHIFDTLDLAPGTYYFTVAALNGATEGPQLPEVSITITALQPLTTLIIGNAQAVSP